MENENADNTFQSSQDPPSTPMAMDDLPSQFVSSLKDEITESLMAERDTIAEQLKLLQRSDSVFYKAGYQIIDGKL